VEQLRKENELLKAKLTEQESENERLTEVVGELEILSIVVDEKNTHPSAIFYAASSSSSPSINFTSFNTSGSNL